MKNKLFILLSAMILFNLIYINADLIGSQSIVLNSATRIVDIHSLIKLDDTFASNNSYSSFPVFVNYYINSLPDIYTDGVEYYEYDYCNFTYTRTHTRNDIFGIAGNDTETYNYDAGNTPYDNFDSPLEIWMYGQDILTLDLSCHSNSSTILYRGDLAGDMAMVFGSYTCNEALSSCSSYNYQQIINNSVSYDTTPIYDKIQTVVTLNYQIWLILSWLLKIGFYLIGIGFIFYGIYYLYKFVKNIETAIK